MSSKRVVTWVKDDPANEVLADAIAEFGTPFEATWTLYFDGETTNWYLYETTEKDGRTVFAFQWNISEPTFSSLSEAQAALVNAYDTTVSSSR